MQCQIGDPVQVYTVICLISTSRFQHSMWRQSLFQACSWLRIVTSTLKNTQVGSISSGITSPLPDCLGSPGLLNKCPWIGISGTRRSQHSRNGTRLPSAARLSLPIAACPGPRWHGCSNLCRSSCDSVLKYPRSWICNTIFSPLAQWPLHCPNTSWLFLIPVFLVSWSMSNLPLDTLNAKHEVLPVKPLLKLPWLHKVSPELLSRPAFGLWIVLGVEVKVKATRPSPFHVCYHRCSEEQRIKGIHVCFHILTQRGLHIMGFCPRLSFYITEKL